MVARTVRGATSVDVVEERSHRRALRFEGASPITILGANGLGEKSPSQLGRSPQNFAKWREIGEALQVRSKNLGAPTTEKKMGPAKIQKMAHSLAY